MLDRLEAEILSLRSRGRRRGASSGANAEEARKPVVKKDGVRRGPRKSGQIQTEAVRPAELFADAAAAVEQQMTLPVPSGSLATEGGRLLGKRQALGRSLSQLRKSGSHRPTIETSS